MNHRNHILMHGFHYLPQVGIQQVFVKSCRKWDSKFHRMMTMDQINEPSNPLDLGDINSVRGGPILWDHGQGILL